MRFISVCTLNPNNRLPTEAEMASMHKLIVEGMKAGWLIECEGVTFGATGVRVHKAASGKVTVSDGPFAETKEVNGLNDVSPFALMVAGPNPLAQTCRKPQARTFAPGSLPPESETVARKSCRAASVRRATPVLPPSHP